GVRLLALGRRPARALHRDPPVPRPHDRAEGLQDRGQLLLRSGKLVFHSYDHFGLDPDDEIKEYGFIDWFTLQHYDRFDGKYPPAIAQADIEIPISGTF
ncbi:hypothetical protein, partial [Streptomyces sp. SID337]|uniref:hypothetical protein n=1 Tax=Streptomyces sp. SID337 TaxID=2690262 RepID=UPI001928242B